MRKRVPSEFGIIVPKDNGVEWVKQGGGMSCIQRTLEGLYIPIGSLRYNLGKPEWTPNDPNFEEKLQCLSLEELPEEDYETFPSYVKERGKFRDADEFFNWIDETETYGWIELWGDLYRFTYGMFDMLESDPRTRWEDPGELWGAIDELFPFTYEEVDYSYTDGPTVDVNFNLDEYPRPESAIRWIRITGSKEYKGKKKAPWADELEGQIVFLMCPNAD